MTAPDQLPGSPTAGSNDLRDQLAEAFDSEPCFGPLEAACVALRIVKPEIDAKDAEIAEAHDALMANLKRAEAAEAEAAKQTADADRLDQLLIDERAITARLGRELAALRALHQQIGDQ